MRVSDQAKPAVIGMRLAAVAGVGGLVVALLLSGCANTVDGSPVAAPDAAATQPSAPRPHPGTPLSPPPPDAIPLPPDDAGYVFIETKSGQTRCQISVDSVGCEAEFTNSPMQDGQHANGVSVTADGTIEWVLGNLGAIPVTPIDYRTYAAQGWTIAATIEGTRFTNNRTGHGMFVSIDNVETF